jgi:chemotaxis protein histidine kinase CheA
VDYLKGTVDFDSAPGKGTLVAIHVPLTQAKDETR